jgi:DNA polymerase III subunit epsilon
MDDLSLAIIDVETTGTNATYDRIIEVGVLKVQNGRVVRTYSTLVDPERAVPYHIERLTGITNRDLKGAPTFDQIKDELHELLEGSIFVAHNARFDYGFVRSEFERHRLDFSARCLCTARLSRLLFPEQKRHNLDSIMDRFGLSCTQRHRAFDDASVLWDFLTIIEERFESEVLKKALKTILKTPSFPPNLHESKAKALPEAPGVYIFWGQEGTPLYAGKSINIKNRVYSHFSNDASSARHLTMCQQVSDITYHETAGELGALLLESHFIKRLAPLYNRRSINRKRLIAAREMLTDQGYRSIQLELLDGLSLQDVQSLVGVFRSKKQAKDHLWEVAKQHSLCPRVLGLEKGKGDCLYRQIHVCRGACTGVEPTDSYNLRFNLAFSGHGITPWPFQGPVLVEEQNARFGTKEAFLLDRWCLLGSYRYDEAGCEDFFQGDHIFDYDAYKILVNFLRDRQECVRPLTDDQAEEIVKRFSR